MLPKSGMKFRFPNGEVELIKEYPGCWKVKVSINATDSEPARLVTKRISSTEVQTWVDEAHRHISCAEKCYMFEDGTHEQIQCQKKCRLAQSVEDDKLQS